MAGLVNEKRGNRAMDGLQYRREFYARSAALDKYQFISDAYLQRRLRSVYDGKAPQDKLDKLEDDLSPPVTPKADKK